MATSTAHTHSEPAGKRVELAIGGMTCASCAARIEKKLNRMDGVTASVNYATEKARVEYAGEVAVGDLIATVEATGYTAAVPAPRPPRRRPRTRTHRPAPRPKATAPPTPATPNSPRCASA